MVHKLEFFSGEHYYRFYFDDMNALMDHLEENNIDLPDYILMGDDDE